jgi:hypothetical protein
VRIYRFAAHLPGCRIETLGGSGMANEATFSVAGARNSIYKQAGAF